jgi:hypothetical protein
MKGLTMLVGGILCYASLPLTASTNDSVVVKKVMTAVSPITSQPSEKVYLHTDKSAYLSGDTIWMETYMVNAISHSPQTVSQYVYVELLNRKDVVLQRKKFQRLKNNTMPGFIALPQNMEEGDYYLRAYTRWMLNASPDYFFYKNLRISASQASLLKTSIKYEEAGSRRTATIQFARTDGEPYARCPVNYMVRTKPTGNAFRQQITNANGEIRVEVPPKEDVQQYIYVILDDKKNLLTHKRTFYVPNVFDYHVDFFPEGGDLIAGNLQKVAFKAQQADGRGIDVDGDIVDSKGAVVAHFQSQHAGIGNLMLQVEPGEQYKAIVRATNSERTITKEFPLPTPSTTHYALTVTTRKGKAVYHILGPKNDEHKAFYLLGHLRGFVLFVNKLEQPSGVIPLDNLPDGIVTLTLMDEALTPYSERLLFVRNMRPTCTMTPDKPNYEARKLVTVDIQVSDSIGISPQGNYSLSVTDDEAVSIDPSGNNIVSELLLSSDLKGYIEDPGFYISNNNQRTQACLDNLMLTQGWSRFNIEQLVRERSNPPLYAPETSQAIQGKVLNGSNPIANKPVIVQVNKKSYPPLFTDNTGSFTLSNISFGETGRVNAYVLEKSKLLRSVLTLDRDRFPQAHNKNIYLPEAPHNKEAGNEDLSLIPKTDSMWVLSLPEVAVTARMKIKDRFSSYKLNDEEMIRQQNPSTAFDLVQKVPGFQIINNRPYLNPKQSLRPEMRMSTDVKNREILRPTGKANYGRPVRFMLDKSTISFNVLRDIDAADIISIHKIDPEVDASLGYIQNHEAIEEAYLEAFENGADEEELESLEFDAQIRNFKDGDFRTSGGCIVLTSRSGELKAPRSDSRGDATVLLGVSKYKQFYEPRYDAPHAETTESDLRRTIHWQPNVPIDANGHGSVSFYTADRKSNYTLTLEGINAKGVPLHCEYHLKRIY